MSIDTIGKQIAVMRKQKGVKQDELAKAIGVSTQAVSKWENGGAPDVYLLPKIADFFGVSVDSLFGRKTVESADVYDVMAKNLRSLSNEQKFKKAFDYCWDIERGLFEVTSIKNKIKDFEENIPLDAQHYSSIDCNYGFTRMGIANRLQYFLLVPEIRDTDKALFEGIDYPAFFELLADKEFFNTLIFLNKRDSKKGFTKKLIMEKLGLSEDKVMQIFEALKQYKMLMNKEVESDEGVITVYMFYPTPSITALLIFAREMIEKPRIFSCQMNVRTKPYFE